MTWGKNDDGLAEHPKFRGLSLRAIGLWTVCRSYAAQHETDGYLAADIVREKVGRHGRGSRVNAIAQELVDAGLWEVAIGGYMIHDYADWNITKVQKDARRAAAAERQRRHREAETGSLAEASRKPRRSLAQASEVIVPAQPVASRRDSRAIDVEVERREDQMTSSSGLDASPPATAELVVLRRDAPTIARSWHDRCETKPDKRMFGRVLGEIQRQLDLGHDWVIVNEAMATWYRFGYTNVSKLTEIIHRLENPVDRHREPEAKLGSVDQKVLQALAYGEEYHRLESETATFGELSS